MPTGDGMEDRARAEDAVLHNLELQGNVRLTVASFVVRIGQSNLFSRCSSDFSLSV